MRTTFISYSLALVLALATACIGEPPPPFLVDVGSGSLTIEDQQLAQADQIGIAHIFAENPGFIAIFDDEADGQGELLGYLAVEAGEFSDLNVVLDEELQGIHQLRGALYFDFEPLGEFEANAEYLAIDEESRPVEVRFTAAYGVALRPTVAVSDQEITPDNQIIVDEVNATDESWIVIYDDDDGAPGEIIGQDRLSSGLHSQVAVDLTAQIERAQILHAVLHLNVDEDDELSESDIIVIIDGQDVRDSFIATPAAPVITAQIRVSHQSASLDEPDRITISSVSIEGANGWIVIFDDHGAQAGEVIGSWYIAEGDHESVVMALDNDIEGDSVLYASVHADLPADGQFTYDAISGDDPPVLDGGAPIMEQFSVSLIDTSAPVLIVDDQTLTSRPLNRINVSEVVYNQPGWVVITDEDSEILGTTEITNDVTVDLTVVFDDHILSDDQFLTATLHRNLGSSNSFDPEVDLPVRDALENVVSEDFLVSLLPNSIEVEDQILDAVSTVVYVTELSTRASSVLQIYAENDAQKLLGSVDLDYGIHHDLRIVTDRPIADGETLVAQLFTSQNSELVEALDSAGDAVIETFTVDVADGTPALRFSVTFSGGYSFSVIPAEYGFLIGSNSNPDLTLYRGWRYRFQNSALSAAPLEFVHRSGGLTPTTTILLSQSSTGIYEDDSQVDWQTDGGRLWFTLTEELGDQLNRYRSGNTGLIPQLGDIEVVSPPGLSDR